MMANTLNRAIQHELIESSISYPVVTIIGPRQSGKTTLARETFSEKPYVNLEAPDERMFAQTDPRRFLEQFPNGAVLDEIQRVPQLLSYIQVIVDEHQKSGMFILTGSHQLALQEEITQSLAGRTGVLKLLPLSLDELKQTNKQLEIDEQLFLGGFPRIYKNEIPPQRFYRDYVQTYVERDVKQMINIRSLDQFQKFLFLCAARVGCVLDYTKISSDLGVSRHTVKEWLSILKASFLVFELQPYFENFGKRIIKSPKLYFTDTGLVSYLLGIQESKQLARHPLRGQLFENFVVTEFMKCRLNRGEEPRLFFYRDSHQNEVDLVFQKGLDLVAIEIKSSQTFYAEFMKPVKKFKEIAKAHHVVCAVVYAGRQEQKVGDVQVLNYQHISEYF